ncbi:MAG: hypothetical protein HOY69_37985, partial [Streptomyces sp.]|nr:hypothetical protein [Streptomyces sp.]
GEFGGVEGGAVAAAERDVAASGAGASRGISCGGQSFSADTKVELADGDTKAISKLRVGDKVKSADTKTGRAHHSETSAVMVNHDTDLYDLKIHTAKGDRVVHTTADHRFFDRTTRSWVEASKLHKGDELTTSDGSTATVRGGSTPAEHTGDMWDITVPGDHDFYVVAGSTPVLVHNCDPAAIAAQAKVLADDVHSKIQWWVARVKLRSTAVTAAEREDGSIVYVVSGSGDGLEAAQKAYIQQITQLDAKGRPNIVIAENLKEAHAEVNAAHYLAANRLKPIAGAANRNACSPDGCTEFLQEVGAQMVGPITLGTAAKIPGQAMYVWNNYETWDYFRAAWGYA